MTAPVVVDPQPLIAAVKAAVAGVAYAEGKKPTVAAGAPYVVAWFDAGTVGNRSLRSRDGFSLVGTFNCYGSTPESVRIAVGKVRAGVMSLFGDVVAGRTVQMPEHLAGPPMQRDDDVAPPLWWQTDEWRFRLA